MKTKYRHIHFTQLPSGEWACYANRADRIGPVMLGDVVYYKPWKCWQFQPEPMTAYTADCCRDIAHFLEQLKGETK